ncbi:beta family protein [Sulfitobacter geojensis]|uniref:Beta family protein n=1 Tax=Sulfitobacter geojensis TaxID=1342299 RepID=A0AAE2W198_9RHOB|nr:beta family protein [Sulfitobacter geojensis]MBM1690697.1 beta family protein [Sulfitobacter geojensis]MBM1694763.1 beta family protein [Sulfitobacter geojensis]MBM1707531.1 beta family protein [Sulfitobacter geojensis]MBM1711141.1 beta family protein [Sulfitobacter geojensis]MBM1715656.1 beta family protein [Sulfitobacter geojensis]
MVIENKSYVPTLAIRASEMNGLEFLPGATKDRMTPCILLAPWANSLTLDRAIDRVERAFPNRSYFLDIDRDYQFTNLESGPQQELARLMEPENGYANWVEFVARHESVWPCIQSRGQSEADLRRQIMAIQELGRPYCMRIVRDRFPNNILEIVAAFAAEGAADFAIILEGGWTRDPLTLSVWFEGVIAESLQAIDAAVPVVLSCTSIPKMFSSFTGITQVPFSNRQLIDQISRRSNRARVIYGDWGSTRPREEGGFGSRPLDRIDYPTDSAWHIVRNKDEEWDFEAAAEELIENSDVWDGDLNVWGEEMIYQTTINEEIGIDTPQKNVAARVNIHLHRQAFHGVDDIGGMNLDEDWED